MRNNEKEIQIPTEEIKQIILDIFKDVKSFIDENDLKYTMYYGTLIGAVRHKGYIPWDVDMDIIMPRPDYDYFIDNYVPKDKNIEMFDPKHCDFYHFAWAKICDKRTVCDEHYRGYKKHPYGIYFDIFPVDGVSPNENIEKRRKKSKQLMAMSCLARFKPTKFWPLHYNIGVTISSILFGWSVNSLKLRDKLIKLSHAVPYDSTDDLMVFANGPAKLMPIKKKWLEETIDGSFEGIPCKITKYYDEALRIQYGDYMKIPDENNRIDNHSFNSYYFKKDLKK